MAGRWATAMLGALGLGELVAETPDDYVAIAARLAGDPERLATLRAGLRPRLTASPLCAGEKRTRQVERLLRAVWRRWCARRPARA